VEILRCWFSGANSRNETAVFTQIVRNFIGIENYSDIKKSKYHDKAEENQFVVRIAAVKLLEKLIDFCPG
ncbi:hypothetical protein OFN34_30210, partial [Escherichia coli]|nr:hypothetical protein [Escherichia coli]